jgi:hypothetical protein
MTVKKTHFGERVLVLIEEKFKTQAELAKALERVQSSIGDVGSEREFRNYPGGS